MERISKELIQSAINSAETPNYIQRLKPLDVPAFHRHAHEVYKIAYKFQRDFVLTPKPDVLKQYADKINLVRKGNGKQPVSIDVVRAQFDKVRSIYRDVMLYFRGDDVNQTRLDISKSLYLYSSTGSGKTLLLDVFKEYTKNVLQQNSFRRFTANEIALDIKKRGIEAIEQYVIDISSNKPIAMYIEDFGTGMLKLKDYGTEVDVMAELIMRRYRYFQTHNMPTHICTNIKPQDLATVFDQRIESRLKEMCNFIDFNLFDFRVL